MHIFQNGTPCQSETCFEMAHVSERHATRCHRCAKWQQHIAHLHLWHTLDKKADGATEFTISKYLIITNRYHNSLSIHKLYIHEYI